MIGKWFKKRTENPVLLVIKFLLADFRLHTLVCSSFVQDIPLKILEPARPDIVDEMG